MHWEKNSKAIMASLLLAKHTEAPHPLQHHSHIPQPFKPVAVKRTYVREWELSILCMTFNIAYKLIAI